MSEQEAYRAYMARREALAKESFGELWLDPERRYVHPFRLYGNVWYVGDAWVCVHLIDTGAGLLLLVDDVRPALRLGRGNGEKAGRRKGGQKMA